VIDKIIHNKMHIRWLHLLEGEKMFLGEYQGQRGGGKSGRGIIYVAGGRKRKYPPT